MSLLITERVSNIPMENREFIQEYAAGRPGIIDLSIGNPDLPTPAYIVNKSKEAIDQGHTRYTGYYGTPELKAAIAKRFREKNGLNYNPEKDIIVTQGVTEGIFICVQSLIDQGDEIIIPTPHYGPYEQAAAFSKGRIIFFELLEEDNYRLDPERLEMAITPKTKVLIFCNPSNPLGDVWPKEDLQEIARIAQKHNLIVISDEIYDGFIDTPYPGSIASLEGMQERTLVLNGFSKVYCMTGFRVGYIAGPEKLIAQIKKLHYTITLCPNSISQKAAEAALECPQNEIDYIVERFRERRRLLCKGLEDIPGLKCFKPKGGLFALPNFEAFNMNAIEMSKYLVREAGVVTLPMNEMGDKRKAYIRLSVCAPEEEIIESMKRIKTALAKL
ncbi:MAG: pyridoxal phosphate-dependent aminotransferase [Bacillota bacterium]